MLCLVKNFKTWIGKKKICGEKMNKEYQMVTVYDYLKMLDKDVKYVNNDAKTIKENVEKYLINMRRAQTNAKLLEVLLA